MGTKSTKLRPGEVALDVRRRGPGREGSPLGNPFILKNERDGEGRAIVCDCYESLLTMTMLRGESMQWSQAEVAEFGRVRGHRGPVCGWDGAKVQDVMRWLVEKSRAHPILLVCQCHPRECHAESVARLVEFELRWADAKAPEALE